MKYIKCNYFLAIDKFINLLLVQHYLLITVHFEHVQLTKKVKLFSYLIQKT